MLQGQIKWKRMGPFDKIWSFGDSWLLAILQKCPTSTMHNFFNFELLEVFFDFLEILRCPLTKPFVSYHFDIPCSCMKLWQKMCFCWLLKWHVMYWLISPKWCIFWNLTLRDKVVENRILFKMGFGWGKDDEACESYAWSKFSWLLLTLI